MASDIWLRTILIAREETRCRHISYSYRFTARVLLYTPSHRQDSTYHGLCYTSRGALAGTRNRFILRPIAPWANALTTELHFAPPHEGSIRRPIAPWANALTTELHFAPPHEGSIRRPIAPWANALTTELHLAPHFLGCRRSAVNGPPRQWSHYHCCLLCWSSETATGENQQIWRGKMTKGVLFQQDNALAHMLLSRNVDSNLSNTHPILLIWLPLTTTSSRKWKRSSVVMNAMDTFWGPQNGAFYSMTAGLFDVLKLTPSTVGHTPRIC